MTMRCKAVVLAAALMAFHPGSLRAQEQGGAHSERQAPKAPEAGADKKLSPEQTMAARYPHPAKVGFLVGLPILDWNDNTLGYVRHVARTPEGKTQLIVYYGGWAGGWLNWGGRLVAVPIEAVQILARQIAASDMPTEEFNKAPTWTPGKSQILVDGDSIKIALARR